MPNPFLFNIIKQYNSPRSKAGRVWRVNLLIGEFCVGDRICLRDVKVESNAHVVAPVFATIKQIQKEVKFEELEFIDCAVEGDIVSINLKDCVCEGKKVKKSDVYVNKSTIGIGALDEVRYINELTLTFAYDERVDLLRIGQEVFLLWFGRFLSVRIKKIDTPKILGNSIVVSIVFSLNGKYKIALPLETALAPYCDTFIVNINVTLSPQPSLIVILECI